MDNNKFLSFWPLPGGAENHIDSLLKIMSYTNDNQPTIDQLKKFFFNTFPNVGSEKVVNSYITTVLKHIDFFTFNADVVSLTEQGKDYLKNPDNEVIFKVLDGKIIGFKEMLIILSKKSLNLEDLHNELLTTLGNGIEWNTFRQTKVRAKWLQSMKFVKKIDDLYTLTESGKILLTKLPITDVTIQEDSQKELIKPIQVKENIKIIDEEAHSVIRELQDSEHAATVPERYEIAIAEAFDYLGFSSEHFGKAGRTDVLATAYLGADQEYSVSIDGKSTSSDKIPERQISWDSINDHKLEDNADYTVVIAPGFAGGDLLERAKKHNILLIETKSLIELVKLHSECPLNLLDYKDIFSQTGVFNLNNCDRLLKRFDKIKKLNDLIPKLLIQIRTLHIEPESSTINDIYWSMGKLYSKEDILEALTILITMDMVKIDDGQYLALMNPDVASRKLRLISNMMKN
jgi:hypothetical protein